MNQLNSIILEGNAVRNADFSEPKAGFSVCRFPLAVNRWYKNKDNEGISEVSYFDIETYGKYAEACSKKIEKGRGLRIVGRLKQDRWADDSGKQHSKIYVVAEHIEFKPKFNNDTESEETTANTEASVQKEKVPAEVVF